MSTSLVLTVIGEDRPGLVEAVSRTVTAHEGEWLESRMSRMAGKFAGIVRVRIPDARIEAVVRDLDALEQQGLRVTAEPGDRVASPAPAAAVTLELVGTDQPGIVRDISRALAGRGVNVEELLTECSEAPMSGLLLFQAKAQLRLPADLTVDALRDELEQVAQSLMVDLTLVEDD